MKTLILLAGLIGILTNAQAAELAKQDSKALKKVMLCSRKLVRHAGDTAVLEEGVMASLRQEVRSAKPNYKKVYEECEDFRKTPRAQLEVKYPRHLNIDFALNEAGDRIRNSMSTARCNHGAGIDVSASLIFGAGAHARVARCSTYDGQNFVVLEAGVSINGGLGVVATAGNTDFTYFMPRSPLSVTYAESTAGGLGLVGRDNEINFDGFTPAGSNDQEGLGAGILMESSGGIGIKLFPKKWNFAPMLELLKQSN